MLYLSTKSHTVNNKVGIEYHTKTAHEGNGGKLLPQGEIQP